MSKQLFPKEIIENSSEANFSKHSVQTKVIYISTVVFLLAIIAALPFIKTDVSVKSRGIIQPITDRNQLTSMVSGQIEKLYINENMAIERGEKVAKISAPLLNEKLGFNKIRQRKVRGYLRDLKLLQNMDSTSIFKKYHLQTAKYGQSYLQFKQQAHNSFQKVRNVYQKFERDHKLFKQKFISEASFEKTDFKLQSARNDYQSLLDQQQNEWQSQQIKYQDELEQLQTKINQLVKEKEQRMIRAPVSGTVQNMKGIYEGSFLSPNQTLAEISPDTGLVAECYIPPKDIGLIKKGMEARMQVSAYNYNQWGILKGKVQEISNDVIMVNNQPVFRVRCSLDQNYLELENGYHGKLKKGMTIQTRFTVTKRSLFQLLYDNVDDWLNPQWNEPSQNSETKKEMQQATF